MKHIVALFILFSLFIGLSDHPVIAAEDASGKPESVLKLIIGGDIYYSRYNLDRDRDEESGEERKGYYILSLPVDLSWKNYLSENVYAAPYLSFRLIYDFGDESWNRNYWNNNQIVGLGARLGKERDFLDSDGSYSGGFYPSLFAEYQFLTETFDNAKSDIPDDVASENFKTGASAWYAKSTELGDGFRFWKEFWGEMAYHTTYFSDEGEDNFLILTLIPKIGLSFAVGELAFEPYVKGAFVNDFFGEEWNEEPWLNYVQYGPGARLSLNKLIPGSLYLYAEYLRVDYLDKKEDLTEDVRVGINFWLPVL